MHTSDSILQFASDFNIRIIHSDDPRLLFFHPYRGTKSKVKGEEEPISNRGSLVVKDDQIISINLCGQNLTDRDLTDFWKKFDGSQLKGLNLAENQITKLNIPAKLESLAYINLGANPHLCTVIFEAALPTLEILDAYKCALERISFLSGFDKLYKIDLHKNKLKECVFEGNCPELVHLFLSENELEQLPEGLLRCEKLETLYLNKNPLTNVPEGVVKEGNTLQDVKNYLLSLVQDGELENDEVKLILIGNSTAGKSSLIRYLVDGEFDENQSSTHGIHNFIWELKDEGFKVNVWDFGGQEFYHATHRLFFSRNAVALVVFEHKTNVRGKLDTWINLYDNREWVKKRMSLAHFPFQYWLKNLEHFSGSKPTVCLVQNKMDETPSKTVPITDQDRQQYKMEEGRDIFRISVKKAYEKQRRFKPRFDIFEEGLFELLAKTK